MLTESSGTPRAPCRAMRAINIVDREYLLGELIGSGGMARVYSADVASKSRIAVKRLHPGPPRRARTRMMRGRLRPQPRGAHRPGSDGDDLAGAAARTTTAVLRAASLHARDPDRRLTAGAPPDCRRCGCRATKSMEELCQPRGSLDRLPCSSQDAQSVRDVPPRRPRRPSDTACARTRRPRSAR